jgi:hypothetical protein
LMQRLGVPYFFKNNKCPEPLLLPTIVIVSSREATEGQVLSKMAALQCFQIHHVVIIALSPTNSRSQPQQRVGWK